MGFNASRSVKMGVNSENTRKNKALQRFLDLSFLSKFAPSRDSETGVVNFLPRGG